MKHGVKREHLFVYRTTHPSDPTATRDVHKTQRHHRAYCREGFWLITPSSARPIVGSQGTFGDANSLPLRFPHSRPRSEIHRHPETTPLQGRCECGSLLGSVPRVPFGATCRWDGDGWVRCPTTGSSPHPLRPPVYQSRSACAGVVVRGLGELEANAWYSRTPYLQRRFPRARPPQGGGHDFAYRYRCVDVLFSVFRERSMATYVAGMMPGRCACRVERWRCKRFLRRCSGGA